MKTFILTPAALIVLLNCTSKSNSSNTNQPETATLSEAKVSNSELSTRKPERITNNEKSIMNNPHYSRTDTTKLIVSNSEWKKILPDSIYHIAREKGTEYPFTGKYWNYEGLGNYYCVVCGNHLFISDAKFASSCGWPSFYETIRKNSVIYKKDLTHGMVRTEVLCGRCDSHLGHVFDDGPKPTGMRFCMNSIMLDFEPMK